MEIQFDVKGLGGDDIISLLVVERSSSKAVLPLLVMRYHRCKPGSDRNVLHLKKKSCPIFLCVCVCVFFHFTVQRNIG